MKDEKLIDYAWGLTWKDEIIKPWIPVHKQLQEIYPPFGIHSSGPFLYIKTNLIMAKIFPTDFDIFETLIIKRENTNDERTIDNIKIVDHSAEDYMQKERYQNLSVQETQKLVMQKIKEEYSDQLHENSKNTINSKRKLIIKRI